MIFQLVSLYELRPPISKKKIVDITKAAMKAIKYYKHVVFGVEKFLMKVVEFEILADDEILYLTVLIVL